MSEPTPPPKKLKLTLKLNSNSNSSSSSSSSSSSGNSSNINSSLPTSNVATPIASSVDASPVKALVTDYLLPAGMGNNKGRGRPKKSEFAPLDAKEDSVKVTKPNSSSSSSASEQQPLPATTANATITTPSIATTGASEYGQELKKFSVAMNSFRSRPWSLKRPIQMEFRNLAGYSISFSCGLWCTNSRELASSHLPPSSSSRAENNSASANGEKTSSLPPNPVNQPPFEAVCQCGKVFDNRSKYRKHAKIHERTTMPPPTTNAVEGVSVNPNPNPSISLKLKFNTKKQ